MCRLSHLVWFLPCFAMFHFVCSLRPVAISSHSSNLVYRCFSAALKPVTKTNSLATGLRINRCFPQFSRREVDRLIESTRISVNNSPATLGTKLKSGDTMTLDGTAVDWQSFADEQLTPYPAGLRSDNGFVYIKYYKAAGVITTGSANQPAGILNTGHFNDVKFPDGEGRLMPVGRLDRLSTGVMILTSDARLPSWLLGANTGCTKVGETPCLRAVTGAQCLL
jgi:hypothetical protein